MKNTSRKSGGKSGNKNKNSSGSGSRPSSAAQNNQNASGGSGLSEETIKKEASQAQESKARAKAASARAKAKNKQTGKSGDQNEAPAEREVLYQVRTRRTSDILLAYITFTYRAFHPNVTGRLLFYAVLAAVPGFFLKTPALKTAFWVLAALIVFLAFFRQYISLALTKRSDADYKSGIEFTYEFTMNDASFYRGDELVSYIPKYKDIVSFYHDEEYFYMGISNRDFFILPKNRFTIGDPSEFEDFIYKRCRKTCRWLPNKFSNKMAQRRARRASTS